MTDEEFWGFLEQCWPAGATAQRQVDPAFVERLATHLEAAPDDALTGFVGRFRAAQVRAHRADLWGPADLALGGVGEDAFMDFRSWLILQGRESYEQVLADPDALAGLTWRADEEDFGVAEWCSALPARIWDQRFGVEMPDSDEDFDLGEPTGDPLPDDPAELRARLPRLWERAHGSR